MSAADALKTHCPRGHPYDELNTYVNPKGSRVCRECMRALRRETERRKRREQPFRVLARKHQYRAKQVGAAGDASAEQIEARVNFYGGRCWMCGDPWRELDHVIALGVGGSNWPANLRPACVSCNRRKHLDLNAERWSIA